MATKATKKARTAVIIGAGPAGLTAAYELLKTTDIIPVIYESSDYVGGISKTVNHKGNRIDMGGHRFFSKSDRIMEWWQEILPLEKIAETEAREVELKYQGKTTTLHRKANMSGAIGPAETDSIMLVRNRLSRIFFLNTFFDYPVSLSVSTVKNLGPVRIAKILASYAKARIMPRKELSLEDFFINKFGNELYLTFFKDYTEKVWGISCSKIEPEWGAQRIKGLSISKALSHMVRKIYAKNPDSDVGQKNTETSLIGKFLYPKYGPGQMWEEVQKKIEALGGKIYKNQNVTGMNIEKGVVTGITIGGTRDEEKITGDYFFSTMPIRDLVAGMKPTVPQEIRNISDGLVYRDFMTVGLLVKKLKIKNQTNIKTDHGGIPDNWIYIQDKGVKLGRLQVFNNWSPYMVKDPKTLWLGLEYFCNEDDELWNMDDAKFMKFAAAELEKIGIIEAGDVLDATLVRVPKAYPAYFGTYKDLHKIRAYTDSIPNLFLIGRNGMHKYNNQDHSMLTAMTAVENIKNGRTTKDNIWSINLEQDYHESKQA